MKRYKGFKMKLYEGQAEEYEKRHNQQIGRAHV